jgi:hypothetical protein
MSNDGPPGGTGRTPEDAALAELENELRAVATRLDPPPADVLAAGRVAFAMRDVDAELAVLLLDSWDADDARALPSVRAGAQPRLLAFALPRTRVELEVTHRDGGHDVVGHVTGVRPEVLELEGPRGRTPCRLDPLGRFLTRMAPGVFRLRANMGEMLVLSPWVTA